MEHEVLHIEGTVENVLYKNENNGYIVLDLDAGGELITVVGELAISRRARDLSLREAISLTHASELSSAQCTVRESSPKQSSTSRNTSLRELSRA